MKKNILFRRVRNKEGAIPKLLFFIISDCLQKFPTCQSLIPSKIYTIRALQNVQLLCQAVSQWSLSLSWQCCTRPQSFTEDVRVCQGMLRHYRFLWQRQVGKAIGRLTSQQTWQPTSTASATMRLSVLCACEGEKVRQQLAEASSLSIMTTIAL